MNRQRHPDGDIYYLLSTQNPTNLGSLTEDDTILVPGRDLGLPRKPSHQSTPKTTTMATTPLDHGAPA